MISEEQTKQLAREFCGFGNEDAEWRAKLIDKIAEDRQPEQDPNRQVANAFFAMANVDITEAALYHQDQSFNNAKYHLRRVIGLCQNDATAHRNLGLVYICEGSFKEAKTECSIVLNLAPNDPFVHFFLAVCFYFSEEASDVYLAREHLRKAIELGMSQTPNVTKFISYLNARR